MKKLLSLALALILSIGLATPAGAFFDMGKVGIHNTVSAGYSYTAAIDQSGTLMINKSGWPNINFSKKIVSISNGQTEGAIIADDNSLWMWGENSYGQVGNGSNLSVQGTPVKVLDNVAAVSCGGYHAAAIKTDGILWMWGANYHGQLGIGTLTDSNVPVKVMDNVLAVSCGGNHTAVIKTDGTLWMFGCNNTSQLGDGWGMDTTGKSGFQCRTSPVKVLDDVVAVSCGWNNTAAIKSDGSLWIWGINGDGQLGNGGTGNEKYYGSEAIQTVPTKIMDDVASVSVGWQHAAAIKTDGSLWTWGENRYGQLGNGGTGNELDGAPANNPEETWFYQTTPVKVMDDVAAVNCAYTHTVAVKTDGSVWAWGENVYDQQGNKAWNVRKELPKGSVGIYQTVPLKIMDHASIPTKPIPTVAGFSDVYANDYYADAVVWAKDTGVTGGTSATTFSPSATVTRAQAMTFLWRAAGSPQPTSEVSPFADVTDTTAYYYNAVLWAAEQGITGGVSATTFGVNSPVAYDQILAFLARTAGDTAAGSDWSAAALDWAEENGLTDGLTFSAKSACPRSDVIYCLWRQLA